MKKFDRPRIFSVDLKEADLSVLKEEGYNLFDGSLGKVTNIEYSSYYINLNLNHIFPENFHEYDIMIMDLTNEVKGDRVEKKDSKSDRRNREYSVLRFSNPVNIFDPRPLSASFIPNEIKKIRGRQFIRIIFACASYSVNYQIVNIDHDGSESVSMYKGQIYDCIENRLLDVEKGHDAQLCNDKQVISTIIKKHSEGMVYHQTFFHPKTYSVESGREDSKIFVPLMVNVNGAIVSYIELVDGSPIFVFPDFRDKGKFLLDFMNDLLPSFAPELFPHSTRFSWKSEEKYFLPKHQNLLIDKEILRMECVNRLNEIDKKIDHNLSKYSFLHNILTETGNSLVEALVKYFQWLEFSNIKVMDENSTSVLEEDIQINLDEKGILIVEVKGIGGTSTDSDCSQVSKIRNRRQKERKAFDVSALYIVNHQRHLPPLMRRNPPFSEHQISDALNDDRGLVTTWQLFNLYQDIDKGLLTKDEARSRFTEYGLLKFNPSIDRSLPKIKELFKDGTVVIVELEGDIILNVGQQLFTEYNGAFNKVSIISIQLHDTSVLQASTGEVGIRLSSTVSNGTKLWTCTTHEDSPMT